MGGTIVLAGTGALDRGERSPRSPESSLSSAASPDRTVTATTVPSPRLPVPALEGAVTNFTRDRDWQVTIVIPADLPDRRQIRLLLYRGDELITDAPVRRAEEQTLEGIPLRRGENLLSAAFRGPSGEGPRSPALVVIRDDVAPEVTVNDPLPGEEVFAEQVTISGDTEPGAQLTVANAATERSSPAEISADGSFRAEIALAPGSNELSLQATDAAGNISAARLTLIRGEVTTPARLTLSQTAFLITRLPGSISLRVVVVDAAGETVDGAGVVFSLSPPGLPTTTYSTATVRGEASWLDVTMSRDGATAGEGFATARVTLPDGSVVNVVRPFTFR